MLRAVLENTVCRVLAGFLVLQIPSIYIYIHTHTGYYVISHSYNAASFIQFICLIIFLNISVDLTFISILYSGIFALFLMIIKIMRFLIPVLLTLSFIAQLPLFSKIMPTIAKKMLMRDCFS